MIGGPGIRRVARGPAAWLLFVAAACGGGDPSAGELTTIRVSGSPHLYIAPLLIADAEGYFAEQGLDLEIIVLPGSSSEAIPALVGGKLEAITGRVSIGIFNAMAQGAPIRIVADQGHFAAGACISDALMARADLGELAPAELRGRRIAVNRMTLDGYYVEAILGRAGLTLEDIDAVTIPNAAMPEALNRGSIDLAAVPEPWVTHLRDAGHPVYAAAHDLMPGLQTRTIVFGPALLEDNPEAGRRFMTAYLKGVRRYNEGKAARNLDILEEETGVERDLLERSCWPSVSDDGRINVSSLLAFQDWAVRKGLLDRAVSADSIWEPRFVEAAAQSLPPAPATDP